MKREIDLELILTPIDADNPCGESLRYDPVFDEIKEARRADDPLDRGEWQQELKTSDWDRVIVLCLEVLSTKTKDLQIGVWLTEALVITEGFEGFIAGIKILHGFLRKFWEHVHPEVEDGDLDFRVGPLEFLNDKIWVNIKDIPLTDPNTTNGYSWLKWHESRQVGTGSNLDEAKRAAREEMIADGKISPEDFDTAVNRSSKIFYADLVEKIELSEEAFKLFDKTIDEKFGKDAPRLAELRKCLEDCHTLCERFLKEKREKEPDPEPETEVAETTSEDTREEEQQYSVSAQLADEHPSDVVPVETLNIPAAVNSVPAAFTSNILSDSSPIERAMWNDANNTLKKSGVEHALAKLLNASCVAPSVREQNRFKLLIAKLCLKVNRPDLARPVVEQLHTMIQTLNLEQWESPVWIAEVLDTYYRCLTTDSNASDDDKYKANTELFQKLCTTDITKAINCKSGMADE